MILAASSSALAEDTDDTSALFAAGVKALADERPNDAVASFEALADRGVIDSVVSYDRGLAYALRVRAGAEQSGDLGRAAHGFEEARMLTHDRKLASDADAALDAVRGEVGRRKAREGVTVDVEQHPSAWRTLAHTWTENGWSWLAVIASFILAAALFVRWLAHGSRARAGAAIAIATAAPLVIAGAALARTSRHDRLWLREAIVISPAARPTDAHGIVLPAEQTLPEAARVEIVDQSAGLTEVRWGTLDAWVPSSVLRPLAKPEG